MTNQKMKISLQSQSDAVSSMKSLKESPTDFSLHILITRITVHIDICLFLNQG